MEFPTASLTSFVTFISIPVAAWRQILALPNSLILSLVYNKAVFYRHSCSSWQLTLSCGKQWAVRISAFNEKINSVSQIWTLQTTSHYWQTQKKAYKRWPPKLEAAASNVGLSINSEKPRSCRSATSSHARKYLSDVNCRIGKASGVFQRLRQVWSTTAIDTKTKIQLYHTIVLPTAIYPSETWKITDTNSAKSECVPPTMPTQNPLGFLPRPYYKRWDPSPKWAREDYKTS